jgi:hypothetical protein
MNRLLSNSVATRRVSISNFAVRKYTSKVCALPKGKRLSQSRTFSSQPPKHHTDEMPSKSVIYGISMTLLGNLILCYVMEEDSTTAETVGRYLPADIRDVMVSVGAQMKSIADPVTNALGIKFAAKKSKVDTLSPASEATAAETLASPELQPPAETDDGVASKEDQAAAAEDFSTIATTTTTAAVQEVTSDDATSSTPPEAASVCASAEVEDAATSSSSSSAVLPSSSSSSSLDEEGSESNAPVLSEGGLGAVQEPTTKIGIRDVTGDIMTQFIALRRELEGTVLKDIDSLDEGALRMRIAQVAGDIFERITWESIQANYAIQKMEMAMEKKYSALMAQQRAGATLELQRRLLDLEKQSFGQASREAQEMIAMYEQQFNSAVKAQAEGFQATLQKGVDEQTSRIRSDMQDQLMHEVATIRKSQTDELMALQPTIDELSSDLQSMSRVAASVQDIIAETVKTRAASAALLSLEAALSALSQTVHTSSPNEPNASFSTTLAEEKAHTKRSLTALTRLCQDHDLSLAVLQSLPPRVMAEGVCSVAELQQRFGVLREEVRKAALAPANAPNKLLGQLVGSTLAAISWPFVGYVRGGGLEEALARAEHFVEKGRFKQALQELDAGVKGTYSEKLMADWKERATERLAVDQSLQVVKAAIIMRHKDKH